MRTVTVAQGREEGQGQGLEVGLRRGRRCLGFRRRRFRGRLGRGRIGRAMRVYVPFILWR